MSHYHGEREKDLYDRKREEEEKKKNLLSCSSGGKTSMYQMEWLLENKRDEYNICGIFANTSWEHTETIEFVNKCAQRWKRKYNFDLIWVEAVVHSGRIGCTHKIVNYKTCKKNMEVFEDVAHKYGVPNNAYSFCTRELKENPIHDYVKKVLGWSNTKKGSGKYYTALGIRIDEPKRLKYKDTRQNKVYPLVDWHPSQPDKLDILDWWENQDFNLTIPEHLGNCVGCFKKSKKKLLKVCRDAPIQFKNNLENKYGHIKGNKINGEYSKQPRTMYREYQTNIDIINTFKITPNEYLKGDEYEQSDDGCSSSCEPFA